MAMDSKTRLLTAWSFQEPDRVPIEMALAPQAEGLPGAEEIRRFVETEADNFRWVPGFDWGFLGLDNTYSEEIIEDVPGKYKRMQRTLETPVGTFTGLTRHNYDDADPNDFHWEKRYVATLEDFRRLAEAPRELRSFDATQYNRGCAEVGNRGLPCTGLLHPLGVLVRQSTMDEVYLWMVAEKRLMLRFLERCTEQICASLLAIRGKPLADPPVFMTYAYEMLIPPWLGQEQFNQLLFPFDQQVNEAVHQLGGRHRAHCHGNSGQFLELFADMGIDSVEPLEPPPYGDNLLAVAKRQVGKRMLLSGNVPSQVFHLASFEPREARELVKQAIEEGAPGGGFTLREAGGGPGNGKTRAQQIKSIACSLVLIEAWREFGSYR